MILTLRLTTDWGSKQALSRSSALSPQELSVHRTQQVLSSHLTAGNLSINLLKRPLLSNLTSPPPKQRDNLLAQRFPQDRNPWEAPNAAGKGEVDKCLLHD